MSNQTQTQPQPQSPAFRDPYADIPDDRKVRFVSMVPDDEYRFLQSVRPQSGPNSGTVQTTANYFFKWLIYELKRRNINSFAKWREFELFIIESFNTERNGVHGGTPSEAQDSVSVRPECSVTGATPSGGHSDSDVANVGANTPKRVAKRSPRGVGSGESKASTEAKG